MSKRASNVHVQIAASGEATRIGKICTVQRQRLGMKKTGLSPEEMRTAALFRPNRAFPAGSDLRGLSATGADTDGARAVAPTRVRNRHIGPARRCECASVRGHLRALLVSDAYPLHQP